MDGSLRLDLIQKYVERPVTWEMLSAPEDCIDPEAGIAALK